MIKNMQLWRVTSKKKSLLTLGLSVNGNRYYHGVKYAKL